MVYMFNKHGWFKKCKARLVVRGDQQVKNPTENTYTATLAGRSFRMLMSIAARFNLELIQYGDVNAFVNADLPYKVYMRIPPRFREVGIVLELHKALYGLRESLLLWQKYFTTTLSKIGFRVVLHEPYCFINNGAIIFVYVNDIVIAFRKESTDYVRLVVDEFKKTYSL